MKNLTNPNWIRLLKLLHVWGTVLLCAGLLGAGVVSLQPEPDQQLLDAFGAYFTRSGGILLLATGLIYSGFTRYGWKRLWIALKWVATALLIAVSVVGQPPAVVLAAQLALLTAIVALSVYKWQRL